MKDLDRMETEADDDVVGCLPPILAPAHRQEIETIVNSLAETIEKGDLAIVENNLERYCKLLKLYQEQPNLLDAYIPELVEKLLKCVELPRADSPTKTLNDLSHAALEYLEHLTTVRGAKVISRLLPHEVSYLHRLLLTLENLSPLVEEGLRSRKMLLLWLWIVCKNPFDMRRFDRKDCPGSTLKQIFQVVEPYLSGMLSKCHYVAALVLSQCIARTDGLLMLNETVETCIRRLGSETDSLGGLILLTALLKHVDRQRIEPYVSRLVAAISPFFPLKSTNALVRKFFVKAVQRLALALLRPRLAAWRYRRGKRSLEESLAAVSSNGHGLGTNGAAKGLLEEEEENCDVSEHVEWVLGCLLEAIQDDDTGVRWSAAKGLGRICSRLPKELASQVVDAIVENNFHRLAGQCSWHGGCMSLAELSRRGFLLPATLPKVFDIVQEALFYEEPMGRQTLGANVRDAACYILWAFARAYEPEDLRPYLDRIATCLMCVTLFDREVRLRRAASAAFQENVGRQSNFPDGIALLTIVDYFAVGNRERCYTQIAIDVSKFAKYSSSLVDHLVERKVIHWDATVRQQTARALYELSAHHGEYLVTKVEQLLEGSASDSPIRRNGSIIALAHLIKGLQDSGHLIRDDQLKAAAQIPGHLRADFNNLRTGELTRVAVTEFIRVCSSVPIPLDEDQIGIWIALLETASVDRKPDFRAKAAAAAGVFMKSYLRPNSVIAIAAKKRIVKEIASTSQGEATRIGYCSLAASLPAEVLDEELFQALCDVILRHGLSDKKWALAREAAVQAIAAVYLSKKHDLWTEKCFETLLRGLEDYTMDIHGDVGRFVRQEAMRALTDILTNATTPETVRESYVDLAVRKMVQQSAEKIGRVRETACNCIVTLLSSPLTSSHISQVPPLSDVYKDGRDFVQDKILTSLTPLLHCPEYYTDIVQGLVLSAGGMSEITGRYSAEAFQVYQEATSDDLEKTERLVGTVADLVDQGMKNTRILDAVLRFLPQLLRRLPSEDSYVDKSAGLSRILSRLKSLLSLPKLSPGRMKLVLSALSSLLLLSASSQTWQTAMQLLAGALSNPLPIIRRAAAESLLESIWATEIDERVVILLSETHWQDSGELEEIVKAAEEIQSLLVQI